MTAPAPIKGYRCDQCKSVSVDPNDVTERYCGRCHQWNTGVVVVANWDDPWAKGTCPVLIAPRLGCSTISHARLGWCAGCRNVNSRTELLAWRLHAMGNVMVPGYRGAIAMTESLTS